MKRFIKKVFISSLILLVISICVDCHISHYLRYNEDRVFKAWGDIYNQQLSNDVVVNGSSRAWTQYNPQIIDSILKVDSYNLGIDGSSINRQILKYNAYCKIQNHRPSMLIQNIDFWTIANSAGYEREQFFPMFVYDRNLMNQFSNYENFSLLEKYCPCYRYWGYPKLVQSAFGLNHLWYGYPLEKGYYGKDENWDGSAFSQIDSIEFSQDHHALNRFCEFINDVTSSGTKVIFVYAPTYIEATKKIIDIEGMYEMFDTIAKKFGIPTLDYNYDSISYDTTCFYNATHLNRKGSNLFSIKLAHDIDSLGILK